MSKNLFISADIEGVAGIADWDEIDANNPLRYSYFADEMTQEVAAVARAAKDFDVTVKDAHATARNLRLDKLPENVTVHRGWSHDLYGMMGGLASDHFDAVAFTGYHSDAWSMGNTLSHTMSRRFQKVLFNGEPISEFVMNAYMAAYHRIPIIFLSGDEALCQKAKELIPGITVVATKKNDGCATLAFPPERVHREMEEKMKEALTHIDDEACMLKLPDAVCVEIEYKDWTEAYRNSFYPNAELKNAKTVAFTSDDYYEAMRFMHFCL